MSNRSYTGLIGFVNKNKLTLVLIVILFSLIKQNIFTNNFPTIVLNKQKEIDDIKLMNNDLINQNVLLQKSNKQFHQKRLKLN